jgi:hypothetical protein
MLTIGAKKWTGRKIPRSGQRRWRLGDGIYGTSTDYLILLALPACPNEIMRAAQTSFIAVRDGLR